MASPSVTYTFANSTTADATQVNTNFTDLINGMTDGTKDFSISALTCAGAATLNGNVTLGNSSGDDLTVTASLASSLSIKTTFSYDFGSATIGLKSLYLGSNDSAAKSVRLIAGAVGTSYTFTLPTSGGTDDYVLKTNGSGTTSWRAWTAPTISKTTASGTASGTGGLSSGTYTTPTGVKWLRVRMVGGGGGGGGCSNTSNNAGTGSTGGNTTFGSSFLTASGGVGGGAGGSPSGGAGGSASLASPAIGVAITGSGGQGGGISAQAATIGAAGMGGNTPFGGAAPGPVYTAGAGNAAVAGSGSGGSGAGGPAPGVAGGGGGAGGYVDVIIPSPDATYSYSVGAGGAGGSAGTSGFAGGAGGHGCIVIEEHYQ